MDRHFFGYRFLVSWVLLTILWHEGVMYLNVSVIDYSSIQQTFRPMDEEVQYWRVELLADALLPAAFTWLYARGVDQRPWLLQGVVFGLVAAFAGVVPLLMRYSAVLPASSRLLTEQLAYYTALMVVLGIVVAFVYRDARREGRLE